MMQNYRLYIFIFVIAVLVIGIAGVAVRYVREIGAARRAIKNLGSQVIETSCGPVEYAKVGEGYPVLFVHGTFGGFDQGMLAAKPVIDAGFQVIAVSRFGYLRSPMPENASADRQADVYACLLDALGIRKAALMTISGGAVSSIRFAARYPERISAFVLQSPSAPGEVKVVPPPEAAFSMMRSDFVYWAMVTFLRPTMQRMIGVPDGFALSPAQEDEVKDLLATTLPSSERIDGFYFDNYGVDAEFEAEIDETSPYSVYHIELPALVISALDDPVAIHANVRGLAEKFPNGRLFEVADGGHLLLGHSAEVNAEVVEFLRSSVAVTDGSQ